MRSFIVEMATENYNFISDISPMFRPFVENIFHDLKLGITTLNV